MTQRQLKAAARKRRALLDTPLPAVKGPYPGLPLSVIARLPVPIVAHSTSYPWAGVALGDRFYGDGLTPKRSVRDNDNDYHSTRDFEDWPSRVLA